MFDTPFPGGQNVRAGASIHCEVNGITYTATIRRDEVSGAPEDNYEGFWPSLDRSAPGWIGDTPAKSFEQQHDECREVMARYRAGKMVYCGVVITARKGGVALLEEFAHALWGVDINWPSSDNAYLVQVANELLDSAKIAAEESLTRAIARAEATLERLKA